MTTSQRRDLLEILEDRYGRAPILVTSQIPIERWRRRCGSLPPHLRLSQLEPLRKVLSETDIAVMFRSTVMLDCFASDHAAACDVCMREAEIAREMVDRGEPLQSIRAEIDRLYGA